MLRVFRRFRLKEPLRAVAPMVGENLPLDQLSSAPSLEVLEGAILGTCSVWRCFNCEDPGCWRELTFESPGVGGVLVEGRYVGGDENRCPVVPLDRPGDSGVGVAD